MEYALILSGQGSEKVGMLRDVIKDNMEAAEMVKKVSELLSVNFFNIIQSNKQLDISDPHVNQILIFMYHNIFSKIIIDLIGELPKFIMGHSLGQLCAYSVAGVISPDEMLRFLVDRTEIINDETIEVEARLINCFGLSYLDAEKIILENKLVDGVEIALHNQQNNVVLAIKDELMPRIKELSTKNKFIIKDMAVARPYHTMFMKKYNEKLLPIIDKLQFQNAKIPILLNHSCKVTGNAQEIKEETRIQMIKQVYWYQGLKGTSSNNYIVLDPTGSQAKILRKIVPGNIFEIINMASLKNINKR